MDQRSHLPSAPLSISNLSWYNRRYLEGSTTQFGPVKEDGFTVYLTNDAIIDLHVGTYKQIPSEAFGLLMGRVYTDDKGNFTVIERVFYAHNLDAGTGYVQLSPEAIHNVRLQATRKHPAMDFVGWTHSHERVSKYSDIDYEEQQTWDDPNHVGILTFMDGVRGIGGTWATMYRGPSSQQLKFMRDATPILRQSNKLPPFMREKQTTQEPIMTPPKLRIQEPEEALRTPDVLLPRLQPQKPTSDNKEQPSRGFRKWFSWQIGRRVIFLPILTLVIVIIGVMLGNFLMLKWSPAVSISSSTNLLWDCNQQSGKAPLTLTCVGPVGPNIQGWSWDFGDGTILQKNVVTHVYREPGMYKITLIISASTQQHSGIYDVNAGSLTINVTP